LFTFILVICLNNM